MALALAGAYLVLVLGLLALQRRILFPAGASRGLPTAPDLETLRVATPSGEVVALHLAGPSGAPTVVHFHGNGEQLADVVPLGRALRERGLSVVLAEYPGYGPMSAQAPSEGALLGAGRALLTHLQRERGVSPAGTMLLGQSLGTGVAVALAEEGRCGALALVSPFTSLPAVAGFHYPFLPTRLLSDRLDSYTRAPRVPVPALVLHGDQDDVVPFALGRQLAGAFADARLVPLEGGHHNDLWGLFGARMLDELEGHARRMRYTPAGS